MLHLNWDFCFVSRTGEFVPRSIRSTLALDRRRRAPDMSASPELFLGGHARQ